MEEPGRPQSMGSQRVGQNWVTSLSLFTFTHWRSNWQPTPGSCLENPRDRGAWWGLPSVGSHRFGHDWCDLAAAAAASLHNGHMLIHSLLWHWLEFSRHRWSRRFHVQKQVPTGILVQICLTLRLMLWLYLLITLAFSQWRDKLSSIGQKLVVSLTSPDCSVLYGWIRVAICTLTRALLSPTER